MTSQPPLEPLTFQPILRRYLWGGRRLQSVLGKALPPGDDYAESWEVCDRPNDQSVVAAGPLAGATLGQLVRERGRELLGRHAPQPRFPLLLKFLDVQRSVSVQVHPSDEQAARMQLADVGKAEACVVLHAEPGSVVYSGLKRGFDRAAFERELHRGTCELCLHRVEPRVGDCLYFPPGVVHAAGAGVLLAEIQQPSDVTFRIYDWNRLGPDGRPRALHIEQALAVIDFDLGPVNPIVPQATDQPGVQRLVECRQFVWERWNVDGEQSIAADGRCRLLAAIGGEMEIQAGQTTLAIGLGQTVLLPACLNDVTIRAARPATVLCAYLP